MQCPTCLRPAQKKACLRNAALRSAASLDRAPSADGVSVEVTAADAPSQPSPSPDAASTPSKASGHRSAPVSPGAPHLTCLPWKTHCPSACGCSPAHGIEIA